MKKRTGAQIKEIARIYRNVFMAVAILLFVIIIFGICYLLSSLLGNMVDTGTYMLIILVGALILTMVIVSIFTSYLLMTGYGEIVDNTNRMTKKICSDKNDNDSE